MLFGLWREIARDSKEQRVLDVFEIDVGESALRDACAESVDVILADRQRLEEEIVAGCEEIHVEDAMVRHCAEDALVVADRVSREEGDADARVRIRFHGAFRFREHEHAGVRVRRVELESRGQVAVIVNGEQTRFHFHRVDFYFVEVNALFAETHFEAICRSDRSESR